LNGHKKLKTEILFVELPEKTRWLKLRVCWVVPVAVPEEKDGFLQ